MIGDDSSDWIGDVSVDYWIRDDSGDGWIGDISGDV